MATTNQPPEGSTPVQWSLSPWQADVFESNARFRIVRAGRRAGKNILAVADQIEYARAPARSPWGADRQATCWWVGPTYDQAYRYGFLKALENLPEHWIDGEPKRSEPYEIPLANGTTIEYRTFDKPESLQGAGVDHLVIDEAPYMPGSIWEGDLRPMLLDNQGCALLIGKPLTRNYFYRLDKRGDSDSPEHADYASWHATSYDNPTIPDSEIDSERGSTSERAFRREYLAEYIDDAGGVFKRVRERIVDEYALDDVEGSGPYATGVDFARHQDWTVIHVLDADGVTVHHERLRDVAWPQIQQAVETAHEAYPGPVAVDATRDNKIVADLEASGLDVEPVTFTPKTKRELVENLVTHVEQEAVTIPDLPVLVSELELFEYDVTAAGNVRYSAPEGEHDDCVDAFALAAHAWRESQRSIRRATRSTTARKRSRRSVRRSSRSSEAD
ncbi:terminase large subunit [Halomarina pelagica]|uniref:terminase large subunit n=1 Tax=Halomarina pelagica TaxID=2961599 RepID=UPI0020C3F6AE|nr:terminase large subunit [Halomarina sp. BND7]